jgi:hypothetical protein
MALMAENAGLPDCISIDGETEGSAKLILLMNAKEIPPGTKMRGIQIKIHFGMKYK